MKTLSRENLRVSILVRAALYRLLRSGHASITAKTVDRLAQCLARMLSDNKLPMRALIDKNVVGDVYAMQQVLDKQQDLRLRTMCERAAFRAVHSLPDRHQRIIDYARGVPIFDNANAEIFHHKNARPAWASGMLPSDESGEYLFYRMRSLYIDADGQAAAAPKDMDEQEGYAIDIEMDSVALFPESETEFSKKPAKNPAAQGRPEKYLEKYLEKNLGAKAS